MTAKNTVAENYGWIIYEYWIYKHSVDASLQWLSLISVRSLIINRFLMQLWLNRISWGWCIDVWFNIVVRVKKIK